MRGSQENDDSADPFIGTTLPNGVNIKAEIGEGGNAVVYLGFHPLLNRRVAVKILRSAADRGVLERFKNEARAAFDLRNEHICRVLEMGITPDGKPFLIMDYLDGETLSTLIRNYGRLSAKQVVEFALQICDGLESAHNAGIVHRDIKPSNIMATNQGQVTILDFGVAKAAHPSTTLTGTGVLVGTPQYMSPEQCRGQQLDQRSDIYSLGVTLYEMITGAPPFRADEPVSLMLKHVHDAPPPIPHQKDPQLKSIEQIILKMLEKDPNARYQTVSDLKSDLNAVKTGKTVKSAPSHVTKNRKKIALIAAASALLLLASYGMYLLAGNRIIIAPANLDSVNLSGELDTNAPTETTLKALKLIADGNFETAEQTLLEALQESPRDVTAMRNLVTVQLKLGKTAVAMQTNMQLIKLDPSAKSNWAEIASASYDRADVSTMIDASAKAIEADPKGVKNYLILYVGARSKGDIKLANDSVRKAEELNTDSENLKESWWNNFQAIKGQKPGETATGQGSGVAATLAKTAMDKWQHMDAGSKEKLKAKAKGAAEKAAAFWKKMRGSE